MNKTYTGYITKLGYNQIFVFGSNPEGRHGMGSARLALKEFGAKYGVGRGLCGKSYALVTKNLRKNYHEKASNITYNKYGKKSVSKEQIVANIKELYEIARKMKDYEFLVAYTAKGLNLNGYTSAEMANMFHEAKPVPNNIIFEDQFTKLIFTPLKN